ncbi:MAG TPA: hypothetical protein VGO58_16240 [Chitinophagaceae bacterium]|nr:hypothetical protein [Chitinophagaceae bacterium]
MKKWLLILFLFVLPGMAAFAQDDEPAQEGGKIQERMREYVQNKLGLSRAEAQRFTPVFVRYFREFAQTHKQFRGDNLILKQRIIELRIRYRTEFRQILDEQRANKVYKYEDEFRQETIRIIKENRRDGIRPRRTRTVLLD